MRRGRRGANGIENREIEPGRPAERAQWIKNGDLDPGSGLRRGCRGVSGIETPKIEPARPAGRALGIKNPRFEPEGEAEGLAGCVCGCGMCVGERTRKGNKKRETRKGDKKGGTKKEDIPWGISSLCAG